MRLRLRSFAGLRLALEPGWHELPSHLPPAERSRLLELLATTVAEGAPVVECRWSDLGHLNLADAAVLLSVPAEIDEAERVEQLAAHTPRLGLYCVEAPGRWPEPAWDERVVKASLVAWLRRSLRSPEHPLAAMGVAELPIDELSAATSEPVELLELLELAVAFAGRERRAKGAVDWSACARWSVGRRLANRLNNAAPELRAALARTLVDAGEGELPTLLERRQLEELARLGLVHFAEGDSLLVPLARQAARPEIESVLATEGVFVPPPGAAEQEARARARTPREAVHALDPRVRVGPDDPWFVDLREHLPWIRDFAERFELMLTHSDAPTTVAVIQRPGSGADTMIRRILAELEERGLVTVTVTGLRPLVGAELHFADLLLAALRSLLAWAEAQPDIELAREGLVRLRGWLAELAAEGEAREYLLLGEGLADEARAPSLLALLRRFADAERAGAAGTGLRARTEELLLHLRALIDEVQGQLAGRGARLCLRFEGLDRVLEPEIVDEAVLCCAEDFARLGCDVVFSLHLIAEFAAGERKVSDVLPSIVYPEAPALEDEPEDGSGPERVAATRALLEARIELDGVLEDVGGCVGVLAVAGFGQVDRVLEVTRKSCARARGKLRFEDVEAMAGEQVAGLEQRVPDEKWPSMAFVMMTGTLLRSERWVFVADLLGPRVERGTWVTPGSLLSSNRAAAAMLVWDSGRHGGVGDLDAAEASLREASEILVEAGHEASRQHLDVLLTLGHVLVEAEDVDGALAVGRAVRLHKFVDPRFAALDGKLVDLLLGSDRIDELVDLSSDIWRVTMQRWPGGSAMGAQLNYAMTLIMADRITEANEQLAELSRTMEAPDDLAPPHMPLSEHLDKIRSRLSDDSAFSYDEPDPTPDS